MEGYEFLAANPGMECDGFEWVFSIRRKFKPWKEARFSITVLLAENFLFNLIYAQKIAGAVW